MRNKLFTLITICSMLFIIQSCKNETYELTFENKTDLVLTVNEYYNNFTSFELIPDEIKTIQSKVNSFAAVFVTIPQTEKQVGYEFLAQNSMTFYQFDYKLEYKITGTSPKVSVKTRDGNGNLAEFTDVELPKSYPFKDIKMNNFYITATNGDEVGDVTVEIWYLGKKVETVTSSGKNVTATATYNYY